MLSPLQKKHNLLLKRAIDIVVSMVVILFVLPWIVPLLAVIIKLDSKGPVFFLQKRNKRQGNLFTCIKFRTMMPNSEADMLPASENDKRITRAGRFLRTCHLDELPQLFNVLKGDMSLVGPRPYMISDDLHYQKCARHYAYRYTVKPGITGPAQLLGYGGSITDEEKIRERMNLDMYYINCWSPCMDLTIVLHTVKALFGFTTHRAKVITMNAPVDYGAFVSH